MCTHVHSIYINANVYTKCVCIDVCGYVYQYHILGKDVYFWTYFFLRINIPGIGPEQTVKTPFTR